MIADAKIFLVYFSFVANLLVRVDSHQLCHVTVNKRVYRADKPLYTHKQYEITFGLPYDQTNPPIGYSIDVDCTNVSKLKAAYSFDIKDAAIEINSINCTKTMNFIHILEAPVTGSQKNSYLTFLVDFGSVFKSLKVVIFEIQMKKFAFKGT